MWSSFLRYCLVTLLEISLFVLLVNLSRWAVGIMPLEQARVSVLRFSTMKGHKLVHHD